MMLENIRFNEGEEINDTEFSKKISKLGDIYVNDAFSVSHRSHASVEGIAKHIPIDPEEPGAIIAVLIPITFPSKLKSGPPEFP